MSFLADILDFLADSSHLVLSCGEEFRPRCCRGICRAAALHFALPGRSAPRSFWFLIRRLPDIGLEILNGKVPILIEGLPVNEPDFLTLMRVRAECGVSGEILSEINDRFSVRCMQNFPVKALPLPDSRSIRKNEFLVQIENPDRMPVCNLFHPRIEDLSFLEVRHPDGAALRTLKGGVRDEKKPMIVFLFVPGPAALLFSPWFCDQLAEKGKVVPVEISGTVDAYAAAIPSVP